MGALRVAISGFAAFPTSAVLPASGHLAFLSAGRHLPGARPYSFISGIILCGGESSQVPTSLRFPFSPLREPLLFPYSSPGLAAEGYAHYSNAFPLVSGSWVAMMLARKKAPPQR
jgi:hypothetical protein